MNSVPNWLKSLRVLTDRKLLAYNLLIVVYSPRILAKKVSRFLADRKRSIIHHLDPGRWATPVFNRQQKTGAPHVVFIGIGWGEMRVVELLTTTLKAKRPDVQVTWAFRDRDAIDTVLKERPQQAVTFMPFDFSPPVLNWLRRLSPDIVVSAEKVWLPNIICASRVWGASTIVVGGRVGKLKHSRLSGGVYKMIYRWTLSGYSTVCLQGKADLAVVAPLLSPQSEARVTGAIKLSHSIRQRVSGSSELAAWMNDARGLPILAAGSTGEGEEEWMLDAFDIVRKSVPCALLLAPRRLHRMDEVLGLLQARGYRFNRRSQFREGAHDGASTPKSAAQIYMLDTIGELAAAYQFSSAAYIGGTLQGRGHNIIEPLEWGVPVFFGPGNGLVVAPQVLCEEAGVGFRVHSPEELAQHWLQILRDPTLRETFRQRSEQVIEQQCRALEDNVAAIVEAVDAKAAEAQSAAKV
jgi:3-deoxy-D-manno-octulosonic-acid transferase